MAEQAEAKALELDGHASVLRQQAVELRKLADTSEALQSRDTVRTISRTMRVSQENNDSYVRRGIKRATRNHPAQRKLYKHGVTISALARELQIGRERVSSWFAKGDANRPIPEHLAKLIESKYGVPLSDWFRRQ
jgi:hypothetical protein